LFEKRLILCKYSCLFCLSQNHFVLFLPIKIKILVLLKLTKIKFYLIMIKSLHLAVLPLMSLFFSIGASAQTINTFPYVQDLEAWGTCGGSCTSTCSLQDFWVNAATAPRDFSVDVNGTSSSSTGPSVDHTTGTSTGKYLYAETSGCTGDEWHLLSPPIDLTGTNNIQFNFWYHMYGTSMGTAHVDVSTDAGSTWTLDVIPSWTDNQDLWQEKTASLGSFTGTALVRIRYEGPTSFGGDMALDDFTIFDLLQNDAGITAFINPVIPTCVFNDTVTVTLTNYGTDTLTSANLNWSWNGTLQTPANFWTGALPSGQSIDVFIATAAYAAGSDLKAWTSNPNGVIESFSGAGNDTTEIIGLSTGLNGVYTIGGTTPDFPDILTAINALNFAGVCGPTTFDIRTGTYYDQFDLGQVIGTNAANTVTFRSEDGHRDSVVIDYGAASYSNNYVVLMDGADYFHFESMTLRNSGASYGRVFDIQGGSDYNVVYDCNIHTQANASTSSYIVPIYEGSGSNDNFNAFEGNSIIGGSYGAYIYGTGSTSLQEGNVFLNNEFVDNYYGGIRLYYTQNVAITGNRIHGQSGYSYSRYGIYAYYCDKASVFTNNSIESNGSSSWRYGMYFNYMDATATGRGLIANNSVTVGDTNSTTTVYGMYIYNSGYYDIYNNSSHVVGGGTSSRALYIYNGGVNNVKNNTFTNFGDGYAAYIYGTYAIHEMDYNNLYSTGSNLGYFDSGNTATFADWQVASGYDANGINVDPGFYSYFDLHVCSDSLNNAGTPLALITDDRDYQPRSASTPDIGSDEFSPLNLPGFLGADALVCAGETVNLYAGTAADDILWSTGDTTSMLAVTTPGTFTVSVIGACGISFDTISVATSALAYTGYLIADTIQFCSGGSALLTTTLAATTYSWTGGSTNDSLVVTTGGTYTLNIADACGTGSESVIITELSTPTASFTQVNSFLTVALTSTSPVLGNTTYAWDFGDGGTSTMMNPSHVYTTVDTFTVTLIVTNECGTNTTTESIITSNLGLGEVLENANITLFPNPSNGEFTIGMDINNNSTIDIRIENILGAIVYESNLGNIEGQHSEVIDLNNAEAGVYFVSITAGDQNIIKKIVIE
jgi:PKD repeat protein